MNSGQDKDFSPQTMIVFLGKMASWSVHALVIHGRLRSSSRHSRLYFGIDFVVCIKTLFLIAIILN